MQQSLVICTFDALTKYNLGNRANSPQSRFVFDLTTALLSRQVQFKKTVGGKWERKVNNECLNQYIQFAVTYT